MAVRNAVWMGRQYGCIITAATGKKITALSDTNVNVKIRSGQGLLHLLIMQVFVLFNQLFGIIELIQIIPLIPFGAPTKPSDLVLHNFLAFSGSGPLIQELLDLPGLEILCISF